MSDRIAVIGAGLSGLSCAAELRAAGREVVVFEKSRGPGGRMSTRRVDEHRFDHGTQFFTARSSAFRDRVARWVAEGVVGPWQARFGHWSAEEGWTQTPLAEERWVGMPRMSAIGRALSEGLEVHYQHEVGALDVERRWRLRFRQAEPQGGFGLVVVTAPGPQAAELLPSTSPTHEATDGMHYDPCTAVMLGYDRPLDLPVDAATFHHPDIAWAACDSSKPGRSNGERWVVHGTTSFSRTNLERTPEATGAVLAQRFADLTGREPGFVLAHRWRYARSTPLDAEPFVYDRERGLALCGDGLSQPRAESAWLSGRALALAILDGT